MFNPQKKEKTMAKSENETTNPAVEEAEAIVAGAEVEVDEDTAKLLDRVSKRHLALAGAATLATVAVAVLIKRALSKSDEEFVEGEDYSV